jgi:hypothetical protein
MACKSEDAIARDRARARQWYRDQSAERKKEMWLKRAYGIDLVTYEAMVKEQEGLCAICQKEPLVLHVDHDHESNRVRGLLCGSCNRAIGLLQESPETLQHAIEYLKRT